MPTYDYQCDACQHKFELFQSITESPKKKCPQCKKSKLRRLFGTGAAIMFKGSGFYITDYRSESYKKAASADAGSAPSTSGDGGAKPETSSKAEPSAKAEPSKPKDAGKSSDSGKKAK